MNNFKILKSLVKINFSIMAESLKDVRSEDEEMRQVFKEFDKNGDGFITTAELREVVTSGDHPYYKYTDGEFKRNR